MAAAWGSCAAHVQWSRASHTRLASCVARVGGCAMGLQLAVGAGNQNAEHAWRILLAGLLSVQLEAASCQQIKRVAHNTQEGCCFCSPVRVGKLSVDEDH
eukprot:589954-Pelagomonas_calceolata.AAC.2